MIDFDRHLRANSARLLEAVRDAAETDGPTLDRPVPPCPDWLLADLVWHLGEVQDFWSHVLTSWGEGPQSYRRTDRPPDRELVDYLASRTDALAAALARPDDEPCWSWSPTGGTVGWVRRRQAQEALVHRVDAELAVEARTPIDDDLAGDGVDEILRVMLDVGELPSWATFEPEARNVVLDAGHRWWSLRLGRFTGIDDDGKAVDLPALAVGGGGDGDGRDLVEAGGTRIAGPAPDMNLWLWGRGGAEALQVHGDPGVVDRLRATAAAATR